MLANFISMDGFRVGRAKTLEGALRKLEEIDADVALMTDALGDVPLVDAIALLLRRRPGLKIIAWGTWTPASRAAALRSGASQLIDYPYKVERVLQSVYRAAGLEPPPQEPEDE